MQSMAYSGNIFSTEDLEATFGVLLASGVLHMSRRRDYWSRNKLKHNQAISDSISRDKFESVFSSLHFVPLDAAPQNDKYQKVRLLFSKLNAKFLLHAPECNSFAIDESMVKYFGRHGCKQHIAGKPIRFGFKVWTLATPLGYCLWMEPYPGKAEQATEKYDLGKSGNVVYYLANILKNRSIPRTRIVTNYGQLFFWPTRFPGSERKSGHILYWNISKESSARQSVRSQRNFKI